jgi:hypothetical protein
MTLVCRPHHFVAPARAVEELPGGPARLAIGQIVVAGEETLDCGEPAGAVAASAVLAAIEAFDALTGGTWHPPLAAVLYRLTGQPAFLDRFFPLAGALDLAERAAFYGEVGRIGRDPGLDLRLIGEDRADLTARMPEDARAIVAAHLVEIFFYRRDLLASFLARPRHIFLYATPRAFAQDGGVAGGDYDPAIERLQLVLSRLYEGFYGEIPGVAPIIHELGHMLDCMVGLLPGMRPADGDLYTPRARSLFLAGKRLELDRYRRRQRGDIGDAPPVGHPYVFQSDGEFVAGFLELFFRTPHYLAGQNPTLFEALVTLFSQDPRRGRPRDFAFYVDENRKAYAPGHPALPDPGIGIPRE